MTYSNTAYFPQNKIEGKFYPLQTQENARACRELTKAQLAVLYHIKTVDPFGDRLIELDMCEVAHLLNLSKLTVYRALLLLNRLGWIHLGKTITVVSSRSDTENKYNNPDIKCVSMCNLTTLSDISMSEPDLNNSEPDLNNSEPDTDMSGLNLKSLPHKGFTPSKTNKTNKTNKISLSDDKSEEREKEEKFMEFAMRKVDQLQKRPALCKKWIDRNYEELRAEYEELEQQRKANEERIRETIEKPLETVLDPIIAAGLASGKIFLDPHPIYPMLKDANGYLHKFDEWIAAEKQRLAES